MQCIGSAASSTTDRADELTRLDGPLPRRDAESFGSFPRTGHCRLGIIASQKRSTASRPSCLGRSCCPAAPSVPALLAASTSPVRPEPPRHSPVCSILERRDLFLRAWPLYFDSAAQTLHDTETARTVEESCAGSSNQSHIFIETGTRRLVRSRFVVEHF